MTQPPGGVARFSGLPRNIAPLGYRNYALFWIGLTVSRFGTSMGETGAVWLVYVLTGSPFLLGVLGIARAVPAILLSPVAGVVADRVDQRKLLFVTQGLGLLTELALGLLVASGRVELWHVYVQVVLLASISTFDGSVRQALFPRLVPHTYLPEAVTLTSIAGRLSQLLGPAIAGIAIATFGDAAPFILDALTFPALMAAAALITGIVPRTVTAGSSFRGELAEGLRYILRAPLLSGLLRLEILFGLLQMNAVLITIVGGDVLGVGPEGLGGLLSAPALGALLGVGYLLIKGQAQRQGRFVIVCMLGYAAALVVFAISRNYVLSFAAIAATGLLDSLSTVTRHSVMQMATPGRMRGRVMANMGTVTRGTSTLAQTQSGVLAGALGAPLAVLTTAAALALSAGLTARTNPTLWRFRRDSQVGGSGEPDQEADAASVADATLP